MLPKKKTSTDPITSGFRQSSTDHITSSFRQNSTDPITSGFRQNSTDPIESGFRQCVVHASVSQSVCLYACIYRNVFTCQYIQTVPGTSLYYYP